MPAASDAAGPDPLRLRRRATIGAMAALAVIAAGAALAMGAVPVPPSEVVAVVSRRLGIALFAEPSTQAEAVLWGIRLPRVLLGLVAGAGLGVAGVALQGLFRNRLADPQLLGIGPGASLGAVIGVIAGGIEGAVAGGAVGGMLTGLLLRRLAAGPSPEPSRLVLTGVALGAALTAWVGFFVFAADRTRVPPVEFWLLGSLAGTTWRTLANATVLTAVGAFFLVLASRTLDILALGESEARHLGVDVALAGTLVLMAVGVTTGAGVGAVGVVGFVGLLVPNLCRSLMGPAHRPLYLAAALGGAALVAGADLLARSAASPVEIPVGLVTAAVGGPFFLWLLRRLTSRRAA